MTLWTVVSLAACLPPGSGAAAAAEPLRIVEGDILVSAQPLSKRGVVFARHRLWNDGVMPVWLDPSIGVAALREVRAAMALWSRVAGVRLDELDAPLGDAQDHVRVEPGEGCASWVGRRGGAQSLWVAPACGRGAVLHELGHALGLEHEHTRPDRDAWIRINWDNVEPRKRHNFDLAPPGTRLLGDYDYASIMHYGADFFGIDSRVTIEPLDPRARIGQRRAPSTGDIAAIAELYGTDLALSADVFDDGRSALLLQALVTNQGRTGAHGVQVSARLPAGWRLAADRDERVPSAGASWRCVGESRLTCTGERLEPGAVAMLSLSLAAPKASRSDGDGDRVALRVNAGNHDHRSDNDTATLRRVVRADGGSAFVEDGQAWPGRDERPVSRFDDPGSRTQEASRDGDHGAVDGVGMGAFGVGWLSMLVPMVLWRRFGARFEARFRARFRAEAVRR